MGKLSKIFIVLLLAGCASKSTPITDVVSPAIKNVDEMLDYAENNISVNDDTKFLMAGLESCRASLVSCETVGNQSIELKEQQVKNLELMIIVAAVIAFIIGRFIRV